MWYLEPQAIRRPWSIVFQGNIYKKNVPVVDAYIILGSEELLVVVQESGNRNSTVHHCGISLERHGSELRQ